MRKLSCMLWILLLGIVSNAQTSYFYYYDGKKQYVELDTKHVFISVSEKDTVYSFASDRVEQTHFQLDIPKGMLSKTNYRRYCAKLSFKDDLSEREYLEKLSEIKNSRNDIIVSPYFKDNTGLSNFFYVKLKTLSDTILLRQEAEKERMIVVCQNEFMPLWFVASITANSRYNAMEAANHFYETGLFEYTEPDLMIAFNSDCVNDPYFSQQWGLNNTNGIDIKACDAWQLSTGTNVIVALLDDGVEEDHPDLTNNIDVISYDAETGTSPQHIHKDGAHGTRCAGVLCAERNNNQGIAGVAPDCKLRSVSFNRYDSLELLQPMKIANGVNWAWQNGADIISVSKSFIPADYSHPNAHLLTDAITAAVTQGRIRNGVSLGTIVVFSAGNNSKDTVNYPSRLPNVIAVGGITSSGERWSPSNYGEGLDVVAPSNNIWTTTTGWAYCVDNGTSFACPHVSGIAALILSVRPDLTQPQVRKIIESTCTKLSGYTYSNNPAHPNGSWNSETGHGLVNAYKAVLTAWFYEKTITGPSSVPVCETATFSFTTPLPPGHTLHWRVSNNFAILSGQGTNSITVQRVTKTTAITSIYVDIMKSGNVITTISHMVFSTEPNTTYTNLSTEDFTVSSNTTWSGEKALGVKATVAQNAILTITGTVYCTDNAQIIVQPGGKLIINGGTLTAACPDDMWKGIIVLGDPTKQQLSQHQGTVTLSNSAVIEHALCAISAAPTSYGNAGGGIITAANATFRNNKQAIEYRPFENKYPDGTIINNVGKFTKCTFTVDKDKYFSFLNYHVSLWEVRGVTFEACTFDDTVPNDLGGACLYTMDAGFKVVNYCSAVASPGIDCACPANYVNIPTTFKHHVYGIYSSSTGNPRSIYIDQSAFDSLDNGLRISNHDNYRLTRCTLTGIFSYGLWSLNSSGYRIEENEFFTSNHASACGIYMSNAGGAENRIYKNNFTNFNEGISVELVNANTSRGSSPHDVEAAPQGLQFICNNFTDNGYDIYIASNGTVRAHQGNLAAGANNIFSGIQANSIYSLGPQTITYYCTLFLGGGNSYFPYNLTSNIIINDNAALNPCASTFCLPDGGGGGGENPTKSTDSLEQYKSMQQQYDEWLAQLKDNPELLQELLVLSDAMRELSDHAISRILGDSILYLENLKPWYEVVRTPVAKYSLAEVYFYERKYDQAEMVLNKIPDMFEFSELEMAEHNNYMKFYNFKKQLQLADRNWTQLDETEIAYLQTIAEATNGRSASMAQGVLCFFFDICYEEKIEEGGDGILPPKNMATETQQSDTQSRDLNYELTLYPNPTSSEMTVVLNTPAVKIVAMELYDLFGKKVYQQTVNQSYGTLKMTELAQGVYILKVRLDQGDVVMRKVVRQ